jgi:hypothetical protein
VVEIRRTSRVAEWFGEDSGQDALVKRGGSVVKVLGRHVFAMAIEKELYIVLG